MRTILHSDVNNFFASVECANRPELKVKPVAVTGNPEKRTGIILAKNEVAKKYGIKTGQTIFEAQKLCPELICLPPHYSLYEKISKQLHEIYLDYTDLVEPMGLDECWLDVTGSLKLLNKTGEEIAHEIRERVKEKFGITVSVGVSFSKIKAHFKEIAYHLPLNSIVGIGRRMGKKFEQINIKTIGDFCKLDKKFVSSIMGTPGEKLLNDLQGADGDKVSCYFTQDQPKSIGNGTTTIIDIHTRDEVEKVIAFLAEKVSKRLIEENFEARTISVSLKTNKLTTLQKETSFPPTFASKHFISQAMNIADQIYDYKTPLRAMRISVSNLQKIDEHRQLSLFDDKAEKSALGIEKITSRFGSDAIFRASESASFINRKNHTEE